MSISKDVIDKLTKTKDALKTIETRISEERKKIEEAQATRTSLNNQIMEYRLRVQNLQNDVNRSREYNAAEELRIAVDGEHLIQHLEERLADVQLNAGDRVVVQGALDALNGQDQQGFIQNNRAYEQQLVEATDTTLFLLRCGSFEAVKAQLRVKEHNLDAARQHSEGLEESLLQTNTLIDATTARLNTELSEETKLQDEFDREVEAFFAANSKTVQESASTQGGAELKSVEEVRQTSTVAIPTTAEPTAAITNSTSAHSVVAKPEPASKEKTSESGSVKSDNVIDKYNEVIKENKKATDKHQETINKNNQMLAQSDARRFSAIKSANQLREQVRTINSQRDNLSHKISEEEASIQAVRSTLADPGFMARERAYFENWARNWARRGQENHQQRRLELEGSLANVNGEGREQEDERARIQEQLLALDNLNAAGFHNVPPAMFPEREGLGMDLSRRRQALVISRARLKMFEGSRSNYREGIWKCVMAVVRENQFIENINKMVQAEELAAANSFKNRLVPWLVDIFNKNPQSVGDDISDLILMRMRDSQLTNLIGAPIKFPDDFVTQVMNAIVSELKSANAKKTEQSFIEQHKNTLVRLLISNSNSNPQQLLTEDNFRVLISKLVKNCLSKKLVIAGVPVKFPDDFETQIFNAVMAELKSAEEAKHIEEAHQAAAIPDARQAAQAAGAPTQCAVPPLSDFKDAAERIAVVSQSTKEDRKKAIQGPVDVAPVAFSQSALLSAKKKKNESNRNNANLLTAAQKDLTRRNGLLPPHSVTTKRTPKICKR